MNFKLRANSIKSVLFAIVLLADGLSASSAGAQSVVAFRGKFTLQHETTWASMVLPVGDYVVTLDVGSGSAIALIRNAATDKSVGIVLSPIADRDTDGRNALLTANRRKHWVVQSFRVAELGKVFIYDRNRADGRGTEEASNTETVPVLQAKR